MGFNSGVKGLKPCSGRFIPRKETRCPLYRSLGEPQGRSGRVRKICSQFEKYTPVEPLK